MGNGKRSRSSNLVIKKNFFNVFLLPHTHMHAHIYVSTYGCIYVNAYTIYQVFIDHLIFATFPHSPFFLLELLLKSLAFKNTSRKGCWTYLDIFTIGSKFLVFIFY